MSESDKALVVFQSKKIRRTWFKDEWHYSLVDIVKALTESINPTDYLKKLRKRDEELGSYLGTNCPHVEMLTETGKKRNVLAGNARIDAERELGRPVTTRQNYLSESEKKKLQDKSKK
ncbi:MAG: hypothetical protein KKF46_00360 [Nanoarchaeota archaeon]|nr:hypothetical protein [Nanoarchaeota archaeon]MBU1320786.1 hypothetical protein [Nanoarchaeota archaeon]MBU1598291.1 hypothetical protein [Nanoarchaeota archaeon]MBU2442255.1 hypothetical protein [Nanoarchaeota archaeon]